jgi:hypothetical protein
MSSNFHLAHGANDAILDARALIDTLPPALDKSLSFDKETFLQGRMDRKQEIVQVLIQIKV